MKLLAPVLLALLVACSPSSAPITPERLAREAQMVDAMNWDEPVTCTVTACEGYTDVSPLVWGPRLGIDAEQWEGPEGGVRTYAGDDVQLEARPLVTAGYRVVAVFR